MENFQEKIDILLNLRKELDSYVWSIFYRYIKEENINFNNPYSWEEDDGGITFSGEDGCMGCYDPKNIFIKMKFFLNPDDAFAERKREREKINKIEKEKRAKIERDYELKLLETLKAKYEGDSND